MLCTLFSHNIPSCSQFLRYAISYSYIIYSLSSGLPPKDMRGLHTNRPRAFTTEENDIIINHIKSFKGRTSHYALNRTKRIYLSEDLNITKMYTMFLEKYPEKKCSYETYRSIFNTKFNISFGHPRKDTCSKCDELRMQIQGVKLKLKDLPGSFNEKNNLLKEKNDLTVQLEDHQKKGQVFYDRKKAARIETRGSKESVAVCFDYQKNLNCPNISTQDVYYSRQLSLFSFNIHVLSSGKAFIYCYDETVGKKGADDVSSMLYDFFMKNLSHEVKNIKLFCDSCAGQNKNWTLMRLMFYLVHNVKRFNTITMTFPVRGHSYMECDRDMANVNQKFPAETPEDWRNVLQMSRSKPEPFNVINMTRDMFLKFTEYFKPQFLTNCPFPSRPIRELQISINHPDIIRYRNSWNGPFNISNVIKRQARAPARAPTQAQRGRSCAVRGRRKVQMVPDVEIPAQILPLVARGRRPGLGFPDDGLPGQPQTAYAECLPISGAKFKDLINLKRFVSDLNKPFFDNLPHQALNNNESSLESMSDESEP